MDGPCSDGKCRGAVTFQGVADHQQFRGVNTLMFAQGQELTLGLVGGNLYVIEIFQQARALQLVLLVLQFSFGEADHLER